MGIRQDNRAGRLAAILILVAVGLGAGCSRLSVAHLQARPWRVGTAETVTMKYWSFAYAACLNGEAYGLRGVARPIPSAAPVWADRLEELTITAYLRNTAGTVLAQADKTYRGQPLTPQTAIPFSFDFRPDPVDAAGDLSVSFGYKAVYGSSKARAALPEAGAPPAGTVFFASEGAMLRD